MPWKMVLFLLAMALVVLFAGFNLTNESDISFGFYELRDIPIFISLFIAFLAGAFLMIPFSFRKKRPKEKKEPTKKSGKDKKKREEEAFSEGNSLYGSDRTL